MADSPLSDRPFDRPDLNLDELIRRWHLRNSEKPLLESPLVWDLPDQVPCPDPLVILLRPHNGDILLSLQTRGSALRALARRPHEPSD